MRKRGSICWSMLLAMWRRGFPIGGCGSSAKARIATRCNAPIDEAGLAERIHLEQPTPAIGAQLQQAHLLAFPSRYEGFPNALAEGMAAGLPVAAFDRISGVEDLIVPGRTAMVADLAGGAPALAEALAALMQSPDHRRALGVAGRERVGAFAPVLIYAQWDQLLDQVCGDGRR